MKKITAYILTVFMSTMLAWSQVDTIPHLIISEMRSMGINNSWYELTNMGDTALNLSSFGVGTGWRDITRFVEDENGTIRPTGNGSPIPGVDGVPHPELFTWLPDSILLPGESWVIMAVSDAPLGEEYPYNQMTAYHNEDKLKYADFLVHNVEPGLPFYLHKPEAESYGWDSVSVWWRLLSINNLHGPMLWYRTETDSFIIDVCNTPLDENNVITRKIVSVAGIEAAVQTHVLCRKFIVKTGNTDWESSRGVDAEDSEWVLYPFHSGRMTYYTVGNHGVFDVIATSDVFDIDLNAETISVPWGTQKGDSIIIDMQLGDGMAWLYIEDTTSVDDSTYTICRDGDILVLYAVGNTLKTKSLKISIGPAPVNIAEVFSRRVKRSLDPINDPVGTWVTPYVVTEGDPVIDTIRGVAFATRVDTFFQFLAKSPGAEWDIEWFDKTPRPDLKLGDLLIVTAEDGTTTKKYYIKVNEYAPNSNAFLTSITWPDYPAEELPDWITGDTIPGFSALKPSYSITLPYGTSNIPALTAKAEDPNAKVKINRALSLLGGIQERTTTITVTAEDDTTINVYTVLFNVEIPPENNQPYIGDPIISEVIRGCYGTGFDCIEIFNPGEVPLDLSQYLIIASQETNPASAITGYYGGGYSDSSNYVNRWRRYVPGYKWKDYTSWQAEGWILQFDPAVDPFVEPKGVFLMSDIWNPPNKTRYEDIPWLMDLANVNFSRLEGQKIGTPLNTWNEHIDADAHAAYSRRDMRNYLFKILNDSVLNGTKPLLADVEDYKLIDCFGQYEITDMCAGRDLSGGDGTNFDFIRKPNVYKGVTDLLADWGTDAESSAWTVTYKYDVGMTNEIQLANGGTHNWAPLTQHISKISSLVYRVSEGWKTLQSIKGNMAATDVAGFYTNLIKADTAQTLAVHSVIDGSIKALDAAIAGGDTLHVTSADGSVTTFYLIQNIPLSSNAVLTATPGSGFAIQIDNSTGTISGITYGASIASVLDSIIVPDLAILNVVNNDNELVPKKILNFDNSYVETMVGGSIFFEVIAEDGTTITYQLISIALSSDAFVISNTYLVDQDLLRIKSIPGGTAVSSFFSNIEVVQGATANVLDKLGLERELGIMAYDDKLEVISQDESKRVIYYLDFLEETEMEVNIAPNVAVAFSDTSLIPGTTIEVSAIVTDDGNPVPPVLTNTWDVVAISGDKATVSIENPDKLTTNVTFSDIGIFKLNILVSDGELSGEGSINVTVSYAEGISSAGEPALNLYPNPASGFITIEMLNMEETGLVIKIFDLTGKVVYNKQFLTNRMIIDVSGFDAGIYFITLKAKDHTFVKRLHIAK